MARDPLCHEATAMLLRDARHGGGDLALTLGAQGGVYIAGDRAAASARILPRAGSRPRFEAKAGLQPYLAAIPTYVVTHPLPAFSAAPAALASE